VRLIAQAPRTVEDKDFVPGDVLPASLHSWPLLASAVRSGGIWVEGSPTSKLFNRDGQPASGAPRVLMGMIRRCAVTSDNPEEPAHLHAAALARDLLVVGGRVQRFFAAESAPVEPMAEDLAAPATAHQVLAQPHAASKKSRR